MEEEKETPTTVEAIDNCTIVVENLANAGRFVNEAEATSCLEAYFRATGTTPSDPDLVYGQTFGLNKIREFLYKIDTYNSEVQETDQQICGIRIYYGKSKRSYLNPPLNNKLLDDVILMPVLRTGEDLTKIHKMLGDDIILSEGRPCPNECGVSFYLA